MIDADCEPEIGCLVLAVFGLAILVVGIGIGHWCWP